MGGHHDPARAAYAHRVGRACRFERELIRARTSEGRERAKARGVHMGRPPKLTKHQKKEALKRRDAGEPTREIARMFNVSHSTISRLAGMSAVHLRRVDPARNTRRFYLSSQSKPMPWHGLS